MFSLSVVLRRNLPMGPVGVEAGLLSAEDAKLFAASGLATHCRRVMIEPLDADPERAVDHADRMERIIADAAFLLPQVHHGDEIASWAVNRRALTRGHGIRTGLEDTPVLPDGKLAKNNAELVAAAMTLISRVAKKASKP